MLPEASGVSWSESGVCSISVITVCRNAVNVISDCIRSVQSQDFPDIEHLVVDGASTDGTLERVQALQSDRLRWISEPDEGLYFALNKGLSLAQGEVVGFLHADDFFAHSSVLSQVSRALTDPRMDACFADLEYVAASDPARIVRFWKSTDFRPGLFGAGSMPPHPTFYARADVYRRFGGFDTRFAIGADWDLLLRLFEIKRIRTVYTPGVTVRMRLGGVSNRSWVNILRSNFECLRAFRKYGIRIPLAYPVAKVCHRLTQFR